MYRSHLYTLIVVAVVALAVGAGVAHASGESALSVPASVLKINPHTCRFATAEVDPRVPAAGSTLRSVIAAETANRRYDVYEDARHDAKLSCVAKMAAHRGRLDYQTAFASGTGQTVTATCPAGYYVTGGGSHSETTGSYEQGNDAWTVVRDHLSPRVLDVTAICIRFAP